MSGFKFSFSIKTEDEKQAQDDQVAQAEEEKDTKEEITKSGDLQWLDAFEIIPSLEIIKDIDELFPKAKLLICGDLDIGHIFPEDAVNYLKESKHENDLGSDVMQAESQHSDLLAGVYEGGLKIWECTNDLSEYLCKEEIEWKEKQVLDLGCGAGILGIIALMSGANVHFQDYNKEVINAVTIPNCLLNIHSEKRETIKTSCKFFSGDWGSLSKLMQKDIKNYKYDYILSSETIYNVDNHRKIYEIFKNHLKNDGIGYVAAKAHYFGVGGGVRQFELLVIKDGLMKCESVWKSTGGLGREIIKLTFK